MDGKKFVPYAGKISNSGTQRVEAPLRGKGNKGNSSVKKGTDLRAGK